MIQKVVSAASRFRKKYTLAIMLYLSGTTMAFIFEWSATEYTAFAALLLGIFGAQDLVDKKMVDK